LDHNLKKGKKMNLTPASASPSLAVFREDDDNIFVDLRAKFSFVEDADGDLEPEPAEAPKNPDENHLNVFDMTPEQIKHYESRMLPDRYSQVGFLKVGQSLFEVCQKDRDTLNKANITYEKMAASLEQFFQYDDNSTLGKFNVRKMCTRGFQPCPFTIKFDISGGADCANHIGSFDITVTNLELKETITFPSLMPHLIRNHLFFEGTDYRLDPEKAIRVLEIKP
jgi:hypothetical protein